MIYAFNDYIPLVHPSAFVHPQANVTGNVIIGADVYIGPGAVLRGDWGQIIIEDGCNVQENCVLHMFPGTTMTLRRGAHIGHGAIVHGATIGVNTLVGMNAVVMDDVTVGDECIVGALCFVPSGKEIPNRSVVVGNPAKIVKAVTDDMLAWKTEGTAWYQRLPQDCRDGLREVEPLREVPANRPVQDTGGLENWKRRSSK
jgi:phenylacetic acid degradation protein